MLTVLPIEVFMLAIENQQMLVPQSHMSGFKQLIMSQQKNYLPFLTIMFFLCSFCREMRVEEERIEAEKQRVSTCCLLFVTLVSHLKAEYRKNTAVSDKRLITCYIHMYFYIMYGYMLNIFGYIGLNNFILFIR